MQSVAETRRERGLAISGLYNAVRRVSKSLYYVKSQSKTELKYTVELSDIEQGWTCTCPDHVYRKQKCKHLWAVEISRALRRNVKSGLAFNHQVISPINSQACPSCKCPDKIVKHGIRHNDYGDIQQFLCKNCGRTFVVNLGFERMKASPQVITSAMQLYFSGESLRNTQKFLRLQGVNVSHVAVLKWIRKYVALMEKYLDKITPVVSETWRTDELYLKIKGNRKYLFAIMDDETRFWIAQQIADNKGVSDIRPLLSDAKKVTGKIPSTIISDGAQNFGTAINAEYPPSQTVHIAEIRLEGQVHNNKMERMNGEIRDREKVMRGLKKEDSAILKGYQIFHNFVREHESLENKTPAEASGITVEGSNKWITLIQNAQERDNKFPKIITE